MPNKKAAAGVGLRERKKQATRAALAEAAVRLAAEHGAENVTVEAISEAAGVSPRTFFNYFDTHDDAFVMIDSETGDRIRRGVLEAPAALSPLEALREALAAELSEVEEQHEVWSLRAKVLQKSPHLLVRSLGAHMADELTLAEALEQRIRGAAGAGPGEDGSGGRGTGTHGNGTDVSAAHGGGTVAQRRAALALYPRLLAAVGTTAVRVSVEHWSAHEGAVFPDIFRRVFEHLTAGLPAPPPES